MKIIESKTKVLREFSKRVPNAESMAIDYGRDTLTVFFDGIHSKEYKVTDILSAYVSKVKSLGHDLQWDSK